MATETDATQEIEAWDAERVYVYGQRCTLSGATYVAAHYNVGESPATRCEVEFMSVTSLDASGKPETTRVKAPNQGMPWKKAS